MKKLELFQDIGMTSRLAQVESTKGRPQYFNDSPIHLAITGDVFPSGMSLTTHINNLTPPTSKSALSSPIPLISPSTTL